MQYQFVFLSKWSKLKAWISGSIDCGLPSKPIGYFGYAIFGHQEGLAQRFFVLRLWVERFCRNGHFLRKRSLGRPLSRRFSRPLV